MRPMTPAEAEKFLADHPKPWNDTVASGCDYMTDANDKYVSLYTLLRYIAYLELQHELPPTEKILREKVKEALVNAVDNGYDMSGLSAEVIAADMQETSSELEPFDYDHILKVVRDAI